MAERLCDTGRYGNIGDVMRAALHLLEERELDFRLHRDARLATSAMAPPTCSRLDVRAGTVIGTCKGRHRSTGFRAFLGQVEAAVPADRRAPRARQRGHPQDTPGA